MAILNTTMTLMIDILQTRSSGATACVSPPMSTSPKLVEKLTLQIDKPGAMFARRHCRRNDGPHDYQPGIYLDLRDAGGHLRLYAACHVHTDEDWAEVAAPKRQARHVENCIEETKNYHASIFRLFHDALARIPVAPNSRLPKPVSPSLPGLLDWSRTSMVY